MMTIVHYLLIAVALFLVTGTLLNFTKHPHWFIRAWDFPRVFVACASAFLAIIYGVLFHETIWDFALIAALILVVIRHGCMIYPYTPIAKKTVKRSATRTGDNQFRLLISNVLMENDDFETWLKVTTEAEPDVIVAVEIDNKWLDSMQSLKDDFPYYVEHSLDNYYGIVLYSKLEFEQEPELKFLVQDDVPSIHGTLLLRDGQRVRIHALHPRPPEPVYHQDSAPRDAELVVLGEEIEKRERNIPTVVCGDLNDVAWSYTTQLFLRLSRLLDPRMGRGMFNSFNAKSRIFRYPLDHVFHSNEFKLVELRILDYVGSDHFPVLIHLSCEPDAPMEQEETEQKPEDHEEADELVEEQVDRELKGKEDGHLAQADPRG